MKIVTVIGARPQFIKAAAVSRKIRKNNKEIIIHTGQHYDDNMSKIFFEELNIPYPDYNLNVGSGGHGAQTGRMLEKIEEIIIKEKPDCLLTYGDTNSTIAGALAASKLLVPVAHVEAGLRSFNMAMPEEQNRILTDHISKYLFAPTETAVKNLYKEGIDKNVFNVGDVMFDAILHFRKIAEEKSNILYKIGVNKKEYILATIHRAENTNDINRLKNIVEALNESKELIILPLHPRTRKYMQDYNLIFEENVKVIDPVGYLDMVMLESNSKKIVSDSGGVQKEAFFLDVPCITLRDETEWVETVENGWNVLVGADKNKIKDAIITFIPDKEKVNSFGDGRASDKIVEILEKNN
ncbi:MULTISPECIES: non-hydrolyzing UDP-N-acetylglucosamine 2-epimerase [Clostridium]|uniref:UDP-2,3-diacetamido-2,3-dideoxy-D-glucuronate 2-epimerase n=2 Tax=Clostridium TaxID=1485 RepID=A0A151AR94_9CLOT|nr:MULTISPECIES: UDP-N-acetylglucosamine 2-epimerase (non-hydrolyzing) [Clostridium]KYH30146.1 UDP-2,3-diacetamido-2,3-dideoxy-D-glucuronate 2-epimerase [Clostridium colicanis DSM 13634]PRR75454.1 UDP-2,3-diacetamido-2,3-dideoxy-D-glucuronate 2-epimerase [Clostridium thermopalmarium DSM 5974]PVZ24356.1 UDP-GlcNAc3NAcA epimerase [Clostridium thermopalmarium DSM 5974]